MIVARLSKLVSTLAVKKTQDKYSFNKCNTLFNHITRKRKLSKIEQKKVIVITEALRLFNSVQTKLKMQENQVQAQNKCIEDLIEELNKQGLIISALEHKYNQKRVECLKLQNNYTELVEKNNILIMALGKTMYSDAKKSEQQYKKSNFNFTKIQK